MRHHINYGQMPSLQSVQIPGFSIASKNPFAAHPLPLLNLHGYHLREIQIEDLSIWCDYLKLPGVKEHISWEVHSPQDLQQFVQAQDWSQAQAQIKFAIANEDNQFIGTIGFHSYSQTNLSAEIAYDLAPTYWGRGIVSAACTALCDWAHQQIGLIRLQACVVDSNQRSLQVLERCHFEREGLLKSYKQIRGQSRDYWMLSHIK